MNLPNKDYSKNYDNKTNKRPLKYELPFIKLNIGRKGESTHIIKKMNNSTKLINSQLDNLLLAGFQGSKEDFNKIYGRNKINKKRKPMRNKYNSSILLRTDLLYKPMRLTKFQEFSFMNKDKDKVMNMKTLLNLYKIKNQILSNEKEQENNKEKNIYDINTKNDSSINMDSNMKNFNKTNTINKDYIIRKQLMKFEKMKKINNIRKLLTKNCRNILNIDNNKTFYKSTNKDNNSFIDNNNNNNNNKNNNSPNKNSSLTTYDTRKHIIKGIIERNKQKKINYNKSSDDINKIFDKYLKEDDEKIKYKKIFGSLADGFKENLKEMKKDKGQYIWIKKSTANLVSFGNSFKLMADDIFYKEHKRIIEKYPGLERDAKILMPERNVKGDKKIIAKLENNERIIRNIFHNSEKILRTVKSKYANPTKSQPSIHKKKKF